MTVTTTLLEIQQLSLNLSDLIIKDLLYFQSLVLQSIGFVGPGIALICLTMARSPLTASAWLTLAVGLKSFSHFGFLVNLQVSIIANIKN